MDDSWWDEPVDGPAPRQPGAQVGRRDVEPWDGDAFDLPPRTGWIGVGVAEPLDDDDGCEMARVLESPPGVHVRNRVGTEHQEELAVWSGQRLQRVGGDRRAVALDLDRGCLHAFDTVHRGLDEHQTVARRRDDLASLLPRIARDHEEHAVEPERSPRLGRDDDVADVDRVERPTEHPEAFHGEECTGAVCSLLRNTHVTRGRTIVSVDEYHALVRVWLPDRPGALGLVASRIGAVDGDIVGIDVLEQGDGVAVDEFAVVLREAAALDLLVREIEEVDGVNVEEVREVEHFPDPRLDALESAASLCAAESVAELRTTLVHHIRDEFLADWSALLARGTVLAAAGGPVPESCVLEALDSGTAASPLVARGRTGPDDLAVASLPVHAATLLVGRDGHPFRRRERAQLLALAGIADRAWTMLENRGPPPKLRHQAT